MLNIPKYKIRPSPERFLLNHVFVLIILGVLLYVGIYVNYFLLGKDIPQLLNGMFIFGIVLILIIDIILCYMRYGHYEYLLYEEHMDLNYGKIHSIRYKDISNISYSKNFLDKWFKTGSINIMLSNKEIVKMKHLKNSNQIYFWLQKKL